MSEPTTAADRMHAAEFPAINTLLHEEPEFDGFDYFAVELDRAIEIAAEAAAPFRDALERLVATWDAPIHHKGLQGEEHAELDSLFDEARALLRREVAK